MPVVLDIIEDAMKQIGALGVGENASAAEAQDALGVLNDMLDSWKTESLLVYAMTERVFTFTAGQSSYTVGTGGNWNIPRPDGIDGFYVRDAQNNDFAVYLTRDYSEYADIVSKQVSTNLPRVAYDDGDYPLRRITLWPVPSDTSYRPVIWVWDVISAFAATTTTIDLPPGYKLAIQNNLALMLCPRYGVSDITQIERLASQSKAQIKRANLIVPKMAFPRELTGGGRWFNYLTGETS